MSKLEQIEQLKDNWNGNGAKAFSKPLIEKVQGLIEGLSVEPQVFPTALGTIQLEFDNEQHDHMEIEIGESDIAKIFAVTNDGKELNDTISITSEEINKRVREFCA